MTLFRPDRRLFEFQADAVAFGYTQWLETAAPALDVQYDMGTGKSPLSLALACVLVEDGHVDKIVIVAEKNKIRDWADIEIPKFTNLDVALYAGTPERRSRIREQGAQVMVMTYETGRTDLCTFKKGSKRAIDQKGPLTEWMEGHNVLVIFDECFVAGTLVDTPSGQVPIESLRVGDLVLNATGSGRVLRTITKTSSVLMKVTAGGKEFFCSPRHPFFTSRGVVQAQHLRKGDLLCERDQAVRVVQGGDGGDTPTLLLSGLLSAMASDSVGDGERSRVHSGPTVAETRGGREDQAGPQSQRVEAAGAGREWSRIDVPSVRPAGVSGKPLGGGTSDRGWARELDSGVTEELRIGHCLSGAQGGGRGGRTFAQHPEEAGVGRSEGPVSGFLRVDSVQMLQRGCPEFDQHAAGADQVTLYDIEVEHHHSFSVEGVLVHNCTKLRNRSSRLHIAWDYAVNRVLRRQKGCKVMAIGLTGTKIETSPADHFNVNRLLAPDQSPSVAHFESTYVRQWDIFGNISDWKNLDPATTARGVTPLSELFADITIRKSKTDPDVMEQFPDKVENPPIRVELSKEHMDFYRTLEEILHAEDDQSIMVLRQAALAPACLIGSQGAFSRSVLQEVGSAGLRALGSAKMDAAVQWAREAADQQMVMFTFFGQSFLPLMHDRLRDEGFSVVVNHGQMSGTERQQAQDVFRSGERQIFLSSDAGARGLNLGVGSALLHLELPYTHAIFEQRSDRIHRINSVHPSVTVDTLLAEKTVEEIIASMVIRRNEWGERVSDSGLVEVAGSDNMTATIREALWGVRKAS